MGQSIGSSDEPIVDQASSDEPAATQAFSAEPVVTQAHESSDKPAVAHARESPRRILCLCGSRSNSAITEMQVENLRLRKHGLELSFLDGPFDAGGAYDAEIQRLFPDHSWFTWVPPGSWCDRASFADGVAHVRARLQADGPFDGLFGFSMGGLVAAQVMAGATGEVGMPRFFLAACSANFAGVGEWWGWLAPASEALQLAAPSLHLIGAQDSIAYMSRQLAIDCNGSTYEMPYAKHEVPMACLGDEELQKTIRAFLARV